MSLIVVKFGGTSVADLSRIKNAALIIQSLKQQGHKILVVVSAMAGSTNKLVSLCMDLSKIDNPQKREEYDAALATGETLSASLFALALEELDIRARSLQAWQVKVQTNQFHNKALIEDIDTELLNNLVLNDIVPVITGFQGVSSVGRVTTIGRGGSDTTAAAIAAAVKADFCDIYTDVDGLYTSDPRLVHDALLIPQIAYEETLELAGIGAKVLHPRSVEICMRYNIALRIFSSFTKKTGTIIMSNVDEINKITAISHLKKLVIIEINGLDFLELVKELQEAEINIHQIIRSDIGSSIIAVNFEYLERLKLLLTTKQISAKLQQNIASVAVVGAAIRHDSALLYGILSALKENEIKILYILNSEIKMTLYINELDVERCVKLLHKKLIKNEK